MSQEKVDQNKELKKNRKKIVKKNKIEKTAWGLGAAICCLIVVGWLGYSGYVKYTEYKKEQAGTIVTPIDLGPINDYISELTGTAEAEAATDAENSETGSGDESAAQSGDTAENADAVSTESPQE